MKSLIVIVPNSTARVPNLRFGFKKTWKETPFSNVGVFLKGKGISKDQLTEEGTQCILYGELYTKYKNEIIKEVFSKTSIDQKGLVVSKNNDVIIPSSGETAIDIATACCVNLDGVLLGGDLNIIRPDKDNGNFISYQLNGKRKQDIAKIAQGSSVTHLYNDSLKKLKIFMPGDRDEQDKIASFLSLIDQRIAFQSKIIEELKVLKSSISKKIFSKQLRFKDDKGNDFPDWKTMKLEEICDIIGGGTPETNKIEYWNGSIQWFTPTEIKTNFVSKSERTITETGLKKSSAKILPKGTILLTTRATIGEVSIALEECTTNQGFQSLVMKKGHSNLFIFNWLKENKYELTKRANGSTFPEISKSEIEKIELNIPNISEQNHIANFLSSIDEKIEVENLLLNKLQTQKRYLLSNLFI